MRKTILTVVAFLAVCNPVFARSGHNRTSVYIGNLGYGGGYGVQGYSQPSYGYRNLPFDGRYSFHSSPLPHSVLGGYWPNEVGGYMNPISGRTGNHFTDAPPVPKVTKNPFFHKVAVQGENGEWTVKTVPND